MARKPMVTRTIKSNKVTFLCMDTVACEPCNETLYMRADIDNQKKMLKVANDMAGEDAPIKYVKVVDVQAVEKKYVMPESLFIETAEQYMEDTEVVDPEDEQEDESEQ